MPNVLGTRLIFKNYLNLEEDYPLVVAVAYQSLACIAFIKVVDG
jgi:hypothetical protein